MTLPLAAALAPEPAAMPLLDIEDSFADVLLEDFVPAGNLAGVRLHLLSLSLQNFGVCASAPVVPCCRAMLPLCCSLRAPAVAEYLTTIPERVAFSENSVHCQVSDLAQAVCCRRQCSIGGQPIRVHGSQRCCTQYCTQGSGASRSPGEFLYRDLHLLQILLRGSSA